MPRTFHVHPAQLYAAVAAVAMGALLSWAFYRRLRTGWVSCLFLLTYPVSRFVLEGWARGDNPAAIPALSDWLTISQYVSLAAFAAGLVWLVLLVRARTAAARG
jgi:phosphatidylglycerol:prolipoprotein diacylglycerol transferase